MWVNIFFEKERKWQRQNLGHWLPFKTEGRWDGKEAHRLS